MTDDIDNAADAEAREALDALGGDTDHPGQTPDEVQPDEGGDVDSPDPGEPGVQPDEGDVDEPGGVPEELPPTGPGTGTGSAPDPLTTLPPD